MTTRRSFLAGVVGTTASASLAGCLGMFDDGSDLLPSQGVETDDELLNAVANPSSQVPPLFFSAYQYHVGELEAEVDLSETIPRAGGAVAGLFAEQLDDVDLSVLDRITGSVYNSSASGGNLQVQPLPSGQAVHATGEFAAEPLLEIVESSEAHRPLGEFEGYERYFAGIGDGDGFEAWAIRDGRLIIVNRTDVTRRSSRYDDQEETARDALAIEFDQLDRDDAPIATAAPAFTETIRRLDSGPIRGGAGYALIPKGADTGTTAFDEAVTGVVGGGVSGTAGDEPTLQRAVTYLDDGMATEETIQAAYDASESEGIPSDVWEFSTDEVTVTARASLSELPSVDTFQTALPVPGYQSLFSRVNPTDLNREPTPRVFFEPSVADGTLQITHIGGVEIEDLRVRYVHDGEIQRESWDGPVAEEDEFTSSETIDSGTQAWITWRPETVDAAVLTRFETPE